MAIRALLIGAGCSKPAGLPAFGDFQKAADETLAAGVFPTDGWKDTFDKALRKWVSISPRMNVEELFVFYDLESRMEEAAMRMTAPAPQWVHDMNGRPSPASTFDRERLRYLIVKTIVERCKKADLAAYSRLVKRTLEEARERKALSIIVTPNWDPLIEIAAREVEPDVALDFVSFREDAPGAERDHPPVLRILKLHGSVDWWLCRNPKCRTLSRAPLETSIHRWEGIEPYDCAKCKATKVLMPVVVPPVSQKFGFEPHLIGPVSDIWWDVRNQLSTCDELYVMGYSFPSTDVEFRAYLQGAIAFNLNLRHIRVLTSSKKGASEENEFKATSRRILDRRMAAPLRLSVIPPIPEVLSPEFSFRGFDGSLGEPYISV